jgi:hypothetical protein
VSELNVLGRHGPPEQAPGRAGRGQCVLHLTPEGAALSDGPLEIVGDVRPAGVDLLEAGADQRVQGTVSLLERGPVGAHLNRLRRTLRSVR